jgi:outer membrane protein
VANRNRIALAVALAAISATAQAHRAGDVIVRAGAAMIDPRESSSELRVDGTALANTGVDISSDWSLGLTATYMFSDNLGIELLAATPFQRSLGVKGLGGLGIDSVGSTKHLPPTISLQYFLLEPDSPFRPYVGVGVNYTTFFEEKLSSEMKSVLQASNLELDDSVGLALQFGVDWQVSERWLVNAAVWRIDLETTATLDSALGEVKVDVDLDPWAYMVGVGYRF